MKLFVLTFYALASLAANWSVIRKGDNFLLKGPNEYIYSIRSVGGKPRFLKELLYEEKYLQLIYEAGSAGTSQPVIIHRAILIDKETHKFLGDLPYRYLPAKGTTYKPAQPVWTLKGKSLKVFDRETGETKTLLLP